MSELGQVIGLIETHCDLDRLLSADLESAVETQSSRYRAHHVETVERLTVVWADLDQLESDLQDEYREILNHVSRGPWSSR